MKRTLAVSTLALVALVSAACGGGGGDEASDAPAPDRTVEVSMVDVAFEPDVLEVEAGETVRFVFTNDGEVRHEAYVGTKDEQADHEDEMAEAAEEDGDGHAHGGGGGDDDGRKVSVEPGDEAELTYRFAEAGTYEIGCHEPGHYDAGMKVAVTAA